MFGLFKKKTPPQPSARAGAGPLPPFSVGNFQGIGTRSDQQDSFASLNVSAPEVWDTEGLLAVVCDGMGGMEDGREASGLAVAAFLERFRAAADTAVPRRLAEGVLAASAAVFDRCRGRGGSTLVAAHLRGREAHFVSCGDSAILLKRGGGVFQVNREHTCLNLLFEAELAQETLDPERCRSDPDGRRLSSFVGMEVPEEVDVSLRPLLLHPGDALLLCSDGVSGVLSPAELREAMDLPPCEGCALLETLVLEKGLRHQDNYTGILIAVNGKESRK